MPMDGVKRRSLERVLMVAGRDRLLCVLYGQPDTQGLNRIVEPYKLYNSASGARLLHCYQLAGEGGGGWRSVPLAEVDRIVPLEVMFRPRGEYAIYADTTPELEDADAPRLRLVR